MVKNMHTFFIYINKFGEPRKTGYVYVKRCWLVRYEGYINTGGKIFTGNWETRRE